MRRPDERDACLVLAFAILAYAGAGFVAAAGLPAEIAALVQQVFFLAIPLAYARWAGLPPLRASGLGRIGVRPLALVLLASLGSLWMLKGLSDLQDPVFRMLGLEEVAKAQEQRLVEAVDSVRRRGAWVAILVFAVLSPVCEEALFRGIALRGLASRMGPVISVLALSLLFASLHGAIAQKVLTFFLGIYFGAVVWLTRSLWAGILAHAVNNAAVLVLTGQYGPKVKGFSPPWWMLVLAFAVFAGALGTLWFDRRAAAEEAPA